MMYFLLSRIQKSKTPNDEYIREFESITGMQVKSYPNHNVSPGMGIFLPQICVFTPERKDLRCLSDIFDRCLKWENFQFFKSFGSVFRVTRSRLKKDFQT